MESGQGRGKTITRAQIIFWLVLGGVGFVGILLMIGTESINEGWLKSEKIRMAECDCTGGWSWSNYCKHPWINCRHVLKGGNIKGRFPGIVPICVAGRTQG